MARKRDEVGTPAGLADACATDLPGVHSDLGWALATVLRAYVQAADHALAGVPGGPRGYRLLTAVAYDCPKSQLALAQQVGLDRTVVTYLIDDLASAGLVERQPDPVDRRARRIVMTSDGTERLCQLEKLLRQTESHVLGDLAGEDANRLRELLQQVAVGAIHRSQEPILCPGIDQISTTAFS